MMTLSHWAKTTLGLALCACAVSAAGRPNFLLILTDDQRYDAFGPAGLQRVQTPNLDRLAARGLRFRNAFVTLSLCSPSRAAVLTGMYGSANGVTTVGRPRLKPGVKTLAHHLGEAGYRTGVAGKWHLGNSPAECGFQFARTFDSNGPFYNRQVRVGDKIETVRGFVDKWVAEQSVAFMKACRRAGRPFFLWMCTQVPHMNHEFDWNVREETLALYPQSAMPVPVTWQDDLTGKPPYLKASRSRQQALEYGYNRAEGIQRHWQRYLAAVTEVDTAIGVALDALRTLELEENTVVCFMSDNGWFLGEHGFTSKVLPYEESMRVPLILAGPKLPVGYESDLVLNIDVPVTMLSLAGLEPPPGVHGKNLLNRLAPPGVRARSRTSFLYEAPDPQLGSHPLWAVRTKRWKYIRTGSTEDPEQLEFEELYDLKTDPREMHNLAADPERASELEQLRRLLQQHRRDPAHDADPHWAAALDGDVAAWIQRAEDHWMRGTSQFDRIEAYAIYRLAARHGSAEAQAKLIELEAALSPIELRLGKISCGVCRRGQASMAGIGMPNQSPRLALSGLVIDAEERTALINGEPFQAGEIQYVRLQLPARMLRVQCLEIGPSWVRIRVDGEERTLSLPGAGSTACCL
jgi:arylsulfatase A-like enzyme